MPSFTCPGCGEVLRLHREIHEHQTYDVDPADGTLRFRDGEDPIGSPYTLLCPEGCPIDVPYRVDVIEGKVSWLAGDA